MRKRETGIGKAAAGAPRAAAEPTPGVNAAFSLSPSPGGLRFGRMADSLSARQIELLFVHL
ncbi:MAG TPA: hypothetical protein VEJ18_01990, partial [Planctomycetota bacterium]|nr:hypothetical protein [Planctomycetota bacterium]